MRLVGWCLAFAAGDAWAIGHTGGRAVWLAVGLALVAGLAAALVRWRRGWRLPVGIFVWLAAGLVVGAHAGAPRLLAPALAAALASDEPLPIEATVLRGPEEISKLSRAAATIA